MKYIIFLFGLMSCVYDPPPGILTIRNSSDEILYYYLTCSDRLQCDAPLDTIWSLGSNAFDASGKQITDTLFYPYYRVEPDSAGHLRVDGHPSKPRVPCENGKLKIFVIKGTNLVNKSWDEICTNNLHAGAFDFSQAELDSLNWSITLP